MSRASVGTGLLLESIARRNGTRVEGLLHQASGMDWHGRRSVGTKQSQLSADASAGASASSLPLVAPRLILAATAHARAAAAPRRRRAGQK
eukprot:4499652-Pleurochrysis_carterae.AAC.1